MKVYTHRQQIEDFVVAICSADTECEAQTCVSRMQHETPVLITRVSTFKREVRVLSPKCQTRIQSMPEHNSPIPTTSEIHVQSVPERDSRVPTTQRVVCVLKQTLPKHEAQTRVSSQKCKVHIQSRMSLKYIKPKRPHPQGFEASPLDAPTTDLRDYLTRKKECPSNHSPILL